MAAGYGRDTWCVGGQYRSGRLAAGQQLLAQAAERILTTPQGTLRGVDESSNEEEEWITGFDVTAYVGAVGPQTAANALPAQVRGALRKDDRFADVLVRATLSEPDDAPESWAITLEITVTPYDETDDFTFTITTDAGGTALAEATL